MENSPLFNHLTLEKIMENLPLADLKSCRLVCTFWNGILASRIIQKSVLCLEGERLNQFLAIILPSTRHRDLVNTTNIILHTPFESYQIKIGSYLSDSDKIERMWTSIHYPIKYLTLHCTTLYAHKNLHWLVINHLPNLIDIKLVVMKYWGSSPNVHNKSIVNLVVDMAGIEANHNLRYFQLSYLGFDDVGERDEFSFPINWKTFFIRFPDLIHLSLVGLSCDDITNMTTALSEFEILGTPQLSLKCLEILDESIFPETPTDENFMQIANISNTFESFHFEICPFATAAAINYAIEKHADSLQILRLRRYPHQFLTDPITLTNTTLNHVNFLEVSDALLLTLSFLPFMPSLRIFHVILRDYRSLPYCEIVANTPNVSNLIHEGLTNLYIEPPLISKDCISKLAICFPSLKSIKLRADNEMFAEICSQAKECHWTDLQSLYITSWAGLTDEGITGISEQVLGLWTRNSNFDETHLQRSMPYIGCIKGLSSLTIEMWSDYNNHIGDWSVYFGILDLKELRDVTFIRSGISSTAFKAIPVNDKRLLH